MAPVCGCPTPTYRLYCKRQGAGGDYCVTVRDGKLFLTLPNNCDPNQLWHKDQSNKCEFMLVNKATNKPVKYGGNGDQLYLVNKPNCPDKSVLWGENGDITCEYGFIRPLCNLSMVMDAWTGHIADGTKVSIHPQKNSDNQRWKLVRC